jgi:drug/metabolite transporter (DMT)-like permease
MTPPTRVPAGPPAPAPSAGMVWLALVTVYLVWGSTYLGIRVVVEADLPPLLSMGARFLAAAALLAVPLAVRGGVGRLRATRRQLVGCLVMGVLLLLGGNGLVAIAEQTVPSGLAALLVATTPLWLVVFRLLARERPHAATWAGILVGFAGVALLALRGGGVAGVQAWGIVVVLVATLSWATGSFFSGRLGLPGDPLVATTYEMLLGGLALTAAGLLAGEAARLDPQHLAAVPTRGWVAWGYLVTVGSMLGYSAYVWLLANAPISLVATYAYVNPVVAVALGWAILAEPITGVVLVGGGLVVLGVALVVRAERPRDPAPPAAPPTRPEPEPEATPSPSPSPSPPPSPSPRV